MTVADLAWRLFSPSSVNRAGPRIEDWVAWRRQKEGFFGYHRDIPAEEIAQRLARRTVCQEEGGWTSGVAVIAFDKEAARSPA